MSRSWRAGSLLVIVFCLAAAGAASRSAQADLAPPLTVQWVQSMGAEPDNTWGPVVMGDRVLATHLGGLYCFDAMTGEQRWQAVVEDQKATTKPLVWKDTVIVGMDSGLLGAVKPTDESVVWQTQCGGYVAPNPIVLDGTLIVGAKQTVLGLDPDTGKTKWACTLLSPIKYGPITDGATLYFRCQDGSLQSVQADTGRFRWRVPVPFGPEQFLPVVGDGRVIVVAGATLHAIAHTGAKSWTAEMPAGIGGRIAVVDDTIYVPCVDGQVYTLYARSGRVLRGAEYRVEGAVTAMPLVTESLVILGTSGSLVYALDRASGAVRWIYRCRAPEQFVDEAAAFGIYAPPLTADGALYVLTGGGDLYSFSANVSDGAGPQFAEVKPPPGEGLGKGGVTISFAAFDDGCGVKVDSVTLTVDEQPLTVRYDLPSGVATALFSQPRDGSHVVKVTAADYRGNVASKEWSFLTDESLTPEEPEEQTTSLRARTDTTRGRTQGGGGMPTPGGTTRATGRER